MKYDRLTDLLRYRSETDAEKCFVREIATQTELTF